MRAAAGRRRDPLWRRLRKKWRHGYVRLLRSPGAPGEVAGGMAVGLFIAMLPTVQMPLAVGATEAVRRLFGRPLSRVAAVVGVWFTNPLTAAPLYGAALLAGRPIARMFLPDRFVSDEGTKLALSLASAGPFAAELFVSLLIGGILLGVPIAVAGYWLTRKVITRYQARRAAMALGRVSLRRALALAP